VTWPDIAFGGNRVPINFGNSVNSRGIKLRERDESTDSINTRIDWGASNITLTATVGAGDTSGATNRYVTLLTSVTDTDHKWDVTGYSTEENTTKTAVYGSLNQDKITVNATSDISSRQGPVFYWDKALTASQRAEFIANPYAPGGLPLFFTEPAKVFAIAAAGGAVTGTGAITIAAAAVAGTADREITACCSISTAAIAITGTGAVGPVVTGTGAITIAAAAVSGTAEREITASGGITFAAVTVSGTGTLGAIITGRTVYILESKTSSGLTLEGPNIVAEEP
jgi:hypothetical protein